LNALRYIYTYDVAKAVPINGEISYAELAETLKVDVGQLKQMLRHAMTARVFHEPRPGYVAHTSPSRLLLVDGPRQFNGYIAEECFPIAASQIDALKKWGHGSQEPNQAAMNLAFNTDLQMFPFLMSQPEREARFSKVLQAASRQDGLRSRHIVSGFDWASLGEATVVDVGGNTGHSSIAIAEAAPRLKCIVQDLASTIAHAQDPAHTIVPPHLQHRISFMPHNFYKPQPVHADVYFLRLIMHDYPDKYAAQILQSLIPAMAEKPGSRIILMDQCKPPVGVVPATVERTMRTTDLCMMMLSNAKERDMEEWTALLHQADPRFRIKNVVVPEGSVLALIEVVLAHESNEVAG
jgi:6-hydroxytryprostatin B O-methyltransferase